MEGDCSYSLDHSPFACPFFLLLTPLVSSTAVQATEQPLALDVFSAIALAPKPELGFDECLDRLRERGSPVLMLYGREDPWVVPLWWVQGRGGGRGGPLGSRTHGSE